MKKAMAATGTRSLIIFLITKTIDPNSAGAFGLLTVEQPVQTLSVVILGVQYCVEPVPNGRSVTSRVYEPVVAGVVIVSVPVVSPTSIPPPPVETILLPASFSVTI